MNPKELFTGMSDKSVLETTRAGLEVARERDLDLTGILGAIAVEETFPLEVTPSSEIISDAEAIFGRSDFTEVARRIRLPATKSIGTLVMKNVLLQTSRSWKCLVTEGISGYHSFEKLLRTAQDPSSYRIDFRKLFEYDMNFAQHYYAGLGSATHTYKVFESVMASIHERLVRHSEEYQAQLIAERSTTPTTFTRNKLEDLVVHQWGNSPEEFTLLWEFCCQADLPLDDRLPSQRAYMIDMHNPNLYQAALSVAEAQRKGLSVDLRRMCELAGGNSAKNALGGWLRWTDSRFAREAVALGSTTDYQELKVAKIMDRLLADIQTDSGEEGLVS